MDAAHFVKQHVVKVLVTVLSVDVIKVNLRSYVNSSPRPLTHIHANQTLESILTFEHYFLWDVALREKSPSKFHASDRVDYDLVPYEVGV